MRDEAVVDGIRESGEARGVLTGAFRLMWTLRRADGPIGLTAVAQRSGVPKSTAHRLLSQLVQVEAVEHDRGRYRIGGSLFELGAGWQPASEVRRAAVAVLPQLGKQTRGSLMLAVPRGDRLVVVAGRAGEADGAMPMPNRFGVSLPWHTAAGQAAEQGALAFDRERVVPGVSCVAAPVLGPNNAVLAALAVVVTTTPVDSAVSALEQAAAELTMRLGAPYPNRATRARNRAVGA
jgi:IclR family transcriptional regulator, acetate operon repressor